MLCIRLNKKGFALSIVLWIVAALLFGVTTLGVLSKDTQIMTGAIDDKLKTEIIVEDILEKFKFYELTGNYNNNSLINPNIKNINYNFPRKIIVDGRWYQLDNNSKISVKDTSGLINTIINDSNLISKIITKNKNKQLYYTILSSIQDWTDKDNIVKLNGAESSTYKLNKLANFNIRNSLAIQHPQEYRLINGIDTIKEKEFDIFKKYMYYGETSLVNLTLVDSFYLSYLLKINEDTANYLFKLKNTNMIKFIQEIQKLEYYNNDIMGFYISKQYRIKIVSSLNLARTQIEAIISFRATENKPYKIISINYD